MNHLELTQFLNHLLKSNLAKKGLTMQAIAEELGCSESLLQSWFAQPLEIPISKLARIAKLLDLEEEIAHSLKAYIL